jgi:hypothetical protein
VEVLPPDMRALEIFVSDTGEFSGSAGVMNSLAAAVAHFCALEGIFLHSRRPGFRRFFAESRIPLVEQPSPSGLS